MVSPATTNRPRSETNVIRTVFVSMIGLLPMGVVSTMMLMQIFGIWTY